MSDDLKYPIGRFQAPTSASADERSAWIDQIDELPSMLQRAVAGLDDGQLDTPYREGGWTLRQVVHHLPDSHTNAYMRFKLALTEENPPIRQYREDRWAELADGRSAPVELSLAFTEALHDRWVYLLRSLSEADWQRTFDHPKGGVFPLNKALAMYAWHGRHHIGHILSLRERRDW